ncbi:DinB family protein [Kribbella sancticallisti]|uniref:DinB family protein n=1 Tax=Kribbella sancticallisti TaxID=460087 RepID=A0ABN2EMJ4_9ACTN
MDAQYGPHRFSGGGEETDALRGQEFRVADLRGARFTDCDLSGVKIVDGCLVDVDISGYVERLVVNGVDVTGFVEAELDRRHPERVRLRGVQDADGFRAMWETVERLWSDAVARAERLPEAARHERVAGEWSFTETLRHLVFITDAWLSRPVLDEERPYHQFGLVPSWYPDGAGLGIDLAAHPSYAEVLQVRADRMALVRRTVDALTDSDLGRLCDRTPAPGYPEGPRPVAECLAVLMDEECEHYRFAVRDLATLESDVHR